MAKRVGRHSGESAGWNLKGPLTVSILSSHSILLMEEILQQLRLVVYPRICKVLYIPGGAGILPSTVLYTRYLIMLAPHGTYFALIDQAWYASIVLPERAI